MRLPPVVVAGGSGSGRAADSREGSRGSEGLDLGPTTSSTYLEALVASLVLALPLALSFHTMRATKFIRLGLSAGAASLAASSAQLDAGPSSGTLTDPRTNMEFALERRQQLLLGVNTRCMLGETFCWLSIARAYSFGAYFDAKALATAADKGSLEALLELLEKHQTAPSASPHPGSVTLVLIFSRDIDGKHLSHGFETSVLKRLRNRAPEPEPSGSSDAVAQLSALCRALEKLNFSVGDQVTFTWGTEREVLCTAKGGNIATLKHAGLCRALFDVYLSPGAVSSPALATFSANLSVLSASRDLSPQNVRSVVESEHRKRAGKTKKE